MSLLNLTSDGLPNLMVLLQTTLLRAGAPMPREQLLTAVAPPDVVDDGGAQVRMTLNRWTTLGLFQEVGGLLTTAVPPAEAKTSSPALVPRIRRGACRAAMHEDNNAEFWAVEGSRAADLTRALAWMLTQDPFRLRYAGFEATESSQIADPGRLLFRNPTRVAGLKAWATFLGFSREPFGDIDPTVAVHDALDEILQPGKGIGATRFVESLARLLPVLDGGRYQREIITGLKPGVLPPQAEGQLTPALSRALLCLRASGSLVLGRKDDIGSAVTLTGRDGARSDLTFHWIERPAVKRRRA